jgi:hypothetical protein
MARSQLRDLQEAEELLEEIASWPEDRIEQLPKFYREKAREYRDVADRLGIA